MYNKTKDFFPEFNNVIYFEIDQNEMEEKMFGEQTLQSDPKLIDIAIRGAHNISNRLFLFEAVKMSESDIRQVLNENEVCDAVMQDQYLEYVHMYRIASI